MAELKSGIVLAENETLVMEIEAELWATSSNPISMGLGEIAKFFAKIFGFKVNGYVVITNKRVVEVRSIISCYCFNVSKKVKYLLPASVKEVGYNKRATFGCCCPAYHLYYDSFTQRTSILLPGVDDVGAQKTVDAFYHAIANSQNEKGL